MSKRKEPAEGLTGNVYEIKVLPNTATELLEAVYEQKDLPKEEAYEMAAYLDDRYQMSGYVPVTKPDLKPKAQAWGWVVLAAIVAASIYISALFIEFINNA